MIDRLAQVQRRIVNGHDVPPGHRIIELTTEEFSYYDDFVVEARAEIAHLRELLCPVGEALHEAIGENARLRHAADGLLEALDHERCPWDVKEEGDCPACYWARKLRAAMEEGKS